MIDKEDIIAEYEWQLQKIRIDKAINYIKENCLTFTEWEEVEIGHLRYIQPKGKIKYKALRKNKVKELLEILEGDDNDNT